MACTNNDVDSALIEEQEEILNLGIVHTSTDGTAVTVDNSQVARAYRENLLRDPTAIACGRARPPCMQAVQRF